MHQWIIVQVGRLSFPMWVVNCIDVLPTRQICICSNVWDTHLFQHGICKSFPWEMSIFSWFYHRREKTVQPHLHQPWGIQKNSTRNALEVRYKATTLLLCRLSCFSSSGWLQWFRLLYKDDKRREKWTEICWILLTKHLTCPLSNTLANNMWLPLKECGQV